MSDRVTQAEPVLGPSLVRIGPRRPENEREVAPRGAGFFVSDRHIVTCAHVVNAALGRGHYEARKPVDSVWLDFPLADDLAAISGLVCCWHTAVRDSRKGDIAVLELTDEPPAATAPADVRRFDTTYRHQFVTIGFPQHHPKGIAATGRLLTPLDRWVQVEDTKREGKRVEAGFSGAAVWDEDVGAVIGMVVAEDRDAEAKTAFLIPTAVLAAACEGVEHAVRSNQARRNTGRIGDERQKRAANSVRRKQIDRERVVGHRTDDLGASFRDRESARERLGCLLANPDTRVVSVLGRAGMGKTALASKVLGDLEANCWPHTDEEIPVDGVAYLSPRTESVTLDRIFRHCSRMIGGDAGRGLEELWADPSLDVREKVDGLLRALHNGFYVFLLDNTEVLLDKKRCFADPALQLFFEGVLGSNVHAKLVLTTRVPVAFPRGWLQRDERIELRTGLPSGHAVSLLRELDPNEEYGLAVAPDDRLEQIVQRVRGVPLALQEIVNRLANDPAVTVDGVLAQLYEREDFVEELVAEGIRLLTGDARRVVEALAVLGRPVDPVAVDEVLAPFVSGLDARPVLDHLIRSKVVSFDRVSEKVFLHALDEAYAYENLPRGHGYSVEALERSAADYYARLGTTPKNWKSIEDVEPELREFEHRVRAGDYEAAAIVLERLNADTLGERGHGMLARRMCADLKGKLKDPEKELIRLYASGTSNNVIGDHATAAGELRAAAMLAKDLGKTTTARDCLAWSGAALRHQGSLGEARADLEFAVALNAGGDGDVWAHNELSLVCTYLRDFGGAIEHAEWLQRQAKQSPSDSLDAAAGDATSLVVLAMGDYDDATRHAERAVRGYLALGYNRTADYPANVLALAWLGRGMVSEAANLLRDISKRAHAFWSPRLEALAVHNLAHARRRQNRLDEALTACLAAVSVFERLSASEAPAARAHAKALESVINGVDGVETVRALLECAQASAYNPDLYPAALLAGEAREISRANADEVGMREAESVCAGLEAGIKPFRAIPRS